LRLKEGFEEVADLTVKKEFKVLLKNLYEEIFKEP